MDKLNEILHELGISKVKLAKFLGVSRQMIYNYLELDDLSKWPKDKKVLLMNLLGIKTPEEINTIKVDTDYIIEVESRINSLFEASIKQNNEASYTTDTENLNDKQKEVLNNIINIIKENMEDDSSDENLKMYEYLYHFLQTMGSSKETKYMLGYIVKTAGFVEPLEYIFNEDEQFLFESLMFSAMTLYNNSNGVSKTKIAEAHKRFVNQIEHKMEEKISRTLQLNTVKVQALKELGFTEINEENAAVVLEKMAEIESRIVN